MVDVGALLDLERECRDGIGIAEERPHGVNGDVEIVILITIALLGDNAHDPEFLAIDLDRVLHVDLLIKEVVSHPPAKHRSIGISLLKISPILKIKRDIAEGFLKE